MKAIKNYRQMEFLQNKTKKNKIYEINQYLNLYLNKIY